MTDAREPWSYGRLLELLAAHPGDRAGVRALWPLVEAWFGEPTPGVANEDDRLQIAVSFGSLDGDEPGPEPPESLGSGPWFCVAAIRSLTSTPPDRGGPHGLEFWLAPNPALSALTRDPRWDTSNLLGFDGGGTAGPTARRLLDAELTRLAIDAAGSDPPALVVRFGSWLDEDYVVVGGTAASPDG